MSVKACGRLASLLWQAGATEAPFEPRVVERCAQICAACRSVPRPPPVLDLLGLLAHPPPSCHATQSFRCGASLLISIGPAGDCGILLGLAKM